MLNCIRMPQFTLPVKPASTKPGFRIGPFDWSIQQMQSFDWLKFKLVDIKLVELRKCECSKRCEIYAFEKRNRFALSET